MRPHPVPMPPTDALRIASAAPHGLLALGIPGCAACLLLPASLAEVRAARPDLAVAIGEFATAEDWRAREELLWPRGIHVSRSSVPALTLLVGGEVVGRRQGSGTAADIDRWLAGHLGPAAHPLPDGPTPGERAAHDALAQRIARQRYVKGQRG